MTTGPYRRLWSRIRDAVREHVHQAMGSVHPSHGIDHVTRVCALALEMAALEGADEDVVEAAAWLHDIGRQAEERSRGRICHAREGARQAAEILQGLGAPRPFIDQVVHCVASHRFRDEEHPATLEAKVLFDADKLDSIGAVGVGRAFLFAGEVGARLHNPGVDPDLHPDRGPEDTALREFTVKLKHVRHRLHTATARRKASGRHDFMVEFFHRLDDEVLGRR